MKLGPKIRTPEEVHLRARLVQGGPEMEEFYIKGTSLDLISLKKRHSQGGSMGQHCMRLEVSGQLKPCK